MPVVLTDKTNATWATENPTDGYLHVGWTGTAGSRLEYALEFIRNRQKQFEKFVEKKKEAERLREEALGHYNAYKI
jgi:hypothetical protein